MIEHVPESWVQEEWRPFTRHAEGKPFWFSWNHAGYPEECVFARALNPMPRPARPEFRLYSLRLPIECLGVA